jgi:hypothetical protein
MVQLVVIMKQNKEKLIAKVCQVLKVINAIVSKQLKLMKKLRKNMMNSSVN